MSKPRPPRDPLAQADTPPSAPATPESSHMTILLEQSSILREIVRRRAYQELLELRAELAGLPPLPSAHDAPASED